MEDALTLTWIALIGNANYFYLTCPEATHLCFRRFRGDYAKK